MDSRSCRRVSTHYDRLASRYDRHWRGYVRQTLDYALDALSLAGTERILDVGCGTGECERMAIARFPHSLVIGIDVSPGMIVVAREKLADHPRASFGIAAAEQLPFGQGTFDVAVCANVLHHISDPRRVLSECARVLRPGGQLVLVDWCRDFWHCRVMHGWLRLVDHTYVKMHRLAEVRTMLDGLGLVTDRACRFVATPFYGMMWCVAEKIVQAPT